MFGPLGFGITMGDGGVERWSPSDDSEITEPTESVLPFLLDVGNFGPGCRKDEGLSTFICGSGDLRGVPLLYWIGCAGLGELRASPGVLGTGKMGAGVGAGDGADTWDGGAAGLGAGIEVVCGADTSAAAGAIA